MTYNQLTREQINERLIEKKLEVLEDYRDTKSEATFHCLICGETFTSKYDRVREWSGEGCKKCKGNIQNYSLEERKKIRLNKILEKKSSSVEFLSFGKTLNYIECKCLLCGEKFIMEYSSIIRGSKHRPCAMKENGTQKLLSKEEVINRSKFFGHNFNIDFTDYHSSLSPLHCHCNICNHDWLEKAKDIIRGRGCPKCAITKRNNSKKKDLSSYGNILDSYKLEYVRGYDCASKDFYVRCKICGHEFKTSITYLNNFNVGCINCNSLKKTQDKLTDFSEKLLQKTHNIMLVGNFFSMNEQTLFYCKDCKNTFFKSPHDLLRSPNCPICTTNSKLEYYISTQLKEYGIYFELHKSFPGLLGINGGELSYDFYLPNYNCLIEAQGEQHEHPVERFGGEKQFIIQLEHDKRKRNYAYANKIELLEIWYWDINKINDILINKFQLNNT